MKHRDWLRLKGEGDNICAVLRQKGYRCHKQTRRLSWKVTKDSNSYVLTWLPAPVGDWTLIPKDNSPAWEQTWAIVQSALNTDESLAMTHQRLEPTEDCTRPWAIVRLLPNAQRYTVARFANRQDAQDHQRFLQRFIPAASFEVVFDAPLTTRPTDPDS
ncbi:MAG TPA: hypothetical protein V6C91_06245 [Coleofasciculaceae cyanobacterium]